jgi:hypothetical protein
MESGLHAWKEGARSKMNKASCAWCSCEWKVSTGALTPDEKKNLQLVVLATFRRSDGWVLTWWRATTIEWLLQAQFSSHSPSRPSIGLMAMAK